MDSLPIQSFPANVPFKQSIVITHYVSMVVAFLGCYPLLLTQQLLRKKNYILGASVLCATIGFITGSFIQPQVSTTTVVAKVVLVVLASLLFIQGILCLYRSSLLSDRLHALLSKVCWKIPKWVDLLLGWVILLIAFSYLTIAALVFTDSCTEDTLQSQCLMPVAMGTGFLLYGTFILLHLLAIIKLPRPSTPEYYEGIILTLWGIISLLLSRTPVLGSEWRAINLGLLWFTGGLFSISTSVQTWIPALREKNIINSIIICLTGRAIVRGITHTEDTYAAEVHTMLGYIFIIGAITRITQIIFRKSPVDNLPHHMFQQNTDTTAIDEDVEEEDTTPCRHRMIFLTLTLLSGLMTALLSIGGGILLMGANIGWLRYMRYYIHDPSVYVNIALGIAFLWCAYVFGLCTIYKNLKSKNAIPYEYMELENQVTTAVYEEPESMPMSPIFVDVEPRIEQEKTVRPSEYRAKRRSLLIQPAVMMNTQVKRSSTHGVGGVLPDEVDPRKSWLSSGSSVGYYSGSNFDSSAPNSPPYSTQRRFSEHYSFEEPSLK